MMMLGAFVALALGNETHGGLPFWLACIGAVVVMAAIGALLERVVLRPTFGQSQIAVVILTIAPGFVLRFAAGAIWGHDPLALESPIAGANVRIEGLVLGLDEIAIVGVTVILTGLLFAFFGASSSGLPCRPRARTSLPPTIWASRSGRFMG